MDSCDLMSSEHFHVVLHANKKHGLIFNRLDDTISTINYDDAKELCNLQKVGSFYGIVGKYLKRYLVLIKSRSLVGSIYEPSTRAEHQIYVINQVQVVDVSVAKLTNETQPNQPSQASSSKSVFTSIRYNTNNSGDSVVDLQELNNKQSSGNSTTGCIVPGETGEDFSDNSEQLNTIRYANDSNSLSLVDDNFSSLPITISTSNYNSHQARSSNPWNPLRLAANSIKNKMPTQFLKSAINNNVINSTTSRDDSNLNQTTSQQRADNSQLTNLNSNTNQIFNERDRRLVEEMIKLFNNTNSFYYSPTLDLTNRFSRKQTNSINDIVKNSNDLWKTANENFFWNKHMLNDLIELSKIDEDANNFINPILQGFVAIEQYVVPQNSNYYLPQTEQDSDIDYALPAASINATPINDCYIDHSENNFSNKINDLVDYCKINERIYKLALISRRSVYQAGTRYNRRGVDNLGNCANFVETEQILQFNQHFNSVIFLRGSIPLYWCQTGYNYRPPPVLIRSEEENHAAFTKHFKNLMKTYETEQIISIDCTEQTGREKDIHDAYMQHMNRLQSLYPSLQLIQFDFHKHCRGRQCSDSKVIQHLKACGLGEKMLKDMKYYWNDGDVVWNQMAIFRVNCIDCSDRTNVVQRAIALQVLDLQLARLGIIAPDTSPEDNNCRLIMQNMWSNNGNILSTQYCGTRALFTGDRKLSGYIKDTYSSASRYYIGNFRDAYRQAAINAMLGHSPSVIENDGKVQEQNDGQSSTSYYELINLDPLILGRNGGALLKNVGNRLARLRGKFHVKPTYLDNIGMSTVETSQVDGEPIDDCKRISKTLEGLNIDWPSAEDVSPSAHTYQEYHEPQNANEKSTPADSHKTVYSQFSNSNDNFLDDDEFSDLMLSVEKSTNLPQKSSDGEKANLDDGQQSMAETEEDKMVKEKMENFGNMTETCGNTPMNRK